MKIDDFIDEYADMSWIGYGCEGLYSKETVKMMLQDLLSLAAKKAEIKVQKKSMYGKNRKWQNVKEMEIDLFDWEIQHSVDKSSILNILK